MTDRQQLNEHVGAALDGDPDALNAIVEGVRGLVFAMALRFCRLPADAEDATQEILLKIVTNLGSFRGDAALLTWVGRVAANHLLSMRRSAAEKRVRSFEAYADAINACPDEPFPDVAETGVESAVLLKETMESCTTGMLLCLERDQRLAFILGAILGFGAPEASAMLEIEPAAYRKRLSRARADLRAFMSGQCGLVNPSAPCRCSRKTRAFVRFGVVDPETLRFNPQHLAAVEAEVQRAMQDGPESWESLFALPHDHPLPPLSPTLEKLLGGAVR